MDEVYDGFISYSHAADDLLAPRLQSGLQRFAKPWWKRRALRVFRDESSLSANPHLWSSITEALDRSSWFVLLLSPDAASSEWVNQEIEYWKTHKDPSRILPVLTDGTFEWTGGDISGTAAPEQLHGSFTEEPRWVDMRFARDEEQLDLKNPRFSAAVADIASALRGIPKDELESEEVKQHRRTVRTAWAAGIALAALAVVAVGASIQSARNAEEAERQAEIAAQNEATAVAEADRADANAEEAEDQRREARAAEALARSGELAASAIGVLDRDPEFALLLTLEAASVAPDGSPLIPEAKIALRRALDANRLIHRMQVAPSGRVEVEFLPGGDEFLVASADDNSLARWEIGASTPRWSRALGYPGLAPTGIAVSPSGDLAALTVADVYSSRTVIVDPATGETVQEIPTAGCPRAGVVTEFSEGFSPDGRFLVLEDGESDCFEPEWMSLIDTRTWSEAYRFDSPINGVSFFRDMTRVALHRFDSSVEIQSFPDLEVLQVIETGGETGLLSPDGSKYAVRNENERGFRPSLWDVETGRLIDRLDAFDSFALDMEFSPDSTSLAAAGTDSSFVWDTTTGEVRYTLPTSGSGAAVSSDGTRLITGGPDGQALIWRLTDESVGTLLDLDPAPGVSWVEPNQISEGPPPAVLVLEFLGDGPPAIHVTVIDPSTGEIEALSPGQESVAHVQLPDGRFVLPNFQGEMMGPPSVWDPADGSVVELEACSLGFDRFAEAAEQGRIARCDDGRPVLGGFMALSLDGSTLAMAGFSPGGVGDPVVEIWDVATLSHLRTLQLETERDWVYGIAGSSILGDGWLMILDGTGGDSDNAYVVYDTATGDLLATLSQPDGWRGATQIGLNHRSVFLSANDGKVWEYDVETWERVRGWQAQNGRGRGLALSPNGSQLASTGEDDFVMIWDLESLTLDDQIPAFFPSDAMWIDDSTLGIIQRSGEWLVVPLDDAALLERAGAAITRSFTPEECRQYEIEPCPTREEIRGGRHLRRVHLVVPHLRRPACRPGSSTAESG